MLKITNTKLCKVHAQRMSFVCMLCMCTTHHAGLELAKSQTNGVTKTLSFISVKVAVILIFHLTDTFSAAGDRACPISFGGCAMSVDLTIQKEALESIVVVIVTLAEAKKALVITNST